MCFSFCLYMGSCGRAHNNPTGLPLHNKSTFEEGLNERSKRMSTTGGPPVQHHPTSLCPPGRPTQKQRVRLVCLQLRSLYLRFVLFTYGGAASREDQIQFLDRKEPSAEKTKPIFHRKQKRPNRISNVKRPSQSAVSNKTNRK